MRYIGGREGKRGGDNGGKVKERKIFCTQLIWIYCKRG